MAAAVLLSAGTHLVNHAGEFEFHVWESPATMDSADTVVLPTRTGKNPRILNAWDATTGDAITATISSVTATLDTGGSTTNHSYVLYWVYI